MGGVQRHWDALGAGPSRGRQDDAGGGGRSPRARPGTRSTFTTLDDMVRNLKEADASARFVKKLRTYLKPAVLVVDEVGYLPL